MFKRPWLWITGVLVIVAAVLAVITITPLTNLVFGRPQCDVQAIRQLPKEVVATVNAQQDQHRLFGSEDITTRPLNDHWESVAHVTFLPKYCGFVGNVTQQPSTDEGAAGEALDYPSGSARQDQVKFVRNGKPFVRPGNDICISNTMPTVRVGQGIEMIFSCDRLYEEDTWASSHPQLTEIQ